MNHLNISLWEKIIAGTALLFFIEISSSQNLIQYVQPLSGTASSTTTSALKHSEAGSEGNANTIPSVGLPFAMTQWTPQTRQTENKCIPPYFYKDSLLSGFRGYSLAQWFLHTGLWQLYDYAGCWSA